MSSYRVVISINVDLSLSESEMFPDGRPSELPPGPLDAADVVEHLRRELSSYRDLEDWGGTPSDALVTIYTPEGQRGFGYLDLRA